MKAVFAGLALALASQAAALAAQDAPPAPAAAPAPAAPAPAAPAPARQFPPPTPPLGDGPWDYDAEIGKIHVEVVTKGLETPWSLAFLPGGDMLVTERPGRLRLVHDGKLDPEPIGGLPAIYNLGVGGLMDVALDPDFASNHLVYLSYSKPKPGVDPKDMGRSAATLAVLRARYDGTHELKDVQDIFVADAWYGDMPLPTRCCGQGPAFGSFGGRIAFGPDGYLYVTSGDRNYGEMVQDTTNDFGKILRLTRDGKPALGNPFIGVQGYRPEIWSIGHRNPLGLYFDPPTGRLWETEFGPRGGDELNLIVKGANYGWIDVTQGHHYNGEPAKHIKGVPGMTDPVFSFGPPSINPGNIVVYRGKLFPDWDGDLLMPTLSKQLVRMEIGPDGAVHAMESFLKEPGQRMRDIKVGPDGAIYILTDERQGALLKLTPGPKETATPKG